MTPMMSQYMKIKSDYSEALLFYRMGDFYELFFEDAKVAASALDIALTKRGKHSGEDIPMCGVPHHSAENYIYTLIKKGFRVAICEQMESPEEKIDITMIACSGISAGHGCFILQTLPYSMRMRTIEK